MKRPVMLDLFSGLGGAHAAMTDRGWTVVSVDINPKVKPDIVADVRALPLEPFPVDLLWASPHCSEYSTKWQFGGWHPDAPYPDLTPWQAVNAIIAQWQPRYWVIENVRAAQMVWGKAPFHFGSRYLWTNLLMLGQPDKRPVKASDGMWKYHHRTRYQETSKIERVISEIVASSVEALLSVQIENARTG